MNANAHPRVTIQAPTSRPPTSHAASVRPFRSFPVGVHRTVRFASNVRNCRVASRPQSQETPLRIQRCELSGASIPSSRMRFRWTSMVSPSITSAVPVMAGPPLDEVPETVGFALASKLARRTLRSRVRRSTQVTVAPEKSPWSLSAAFEGT